MISCFNTLYVVGSTTLVEFCQMVLEFQYIICRWFNICVSSFAVSFGCFNTLYVVGSKLLNYYNSIV